jgi:putative flippase GtrA
MAIAHTVHLFGRHQLVSIVATAVDFSLMIAAVRLLRVTPVVGTVIGASVGAVTSFALGRHWTFGATHDAPHHQAFRYVLVSAVSLGWNALGEWLLALELGMQYVAARAITALVVGWLWNFPMHRHFVFPLPRSS